MIYRASIVLVVVVGMMLGANSVATEERTNSDDMWERMLVSNDAVPEPDDSPAPPVSGPPPRKHLEQLRLLKLLEFLDLDEGADMEFIVAFRSFRKGERELHDVRRELVDTLATGIKEDGLSDSEIYALVEQIRENDLARQTHREKFLGEIRSLLSAEQYARFVIFNEKFELELLENVRSFRERRGRHGGNPGPGKPDRDHVPSFELY